MKRVCFFLCLSRLLVAVVIFSGCGVRCVQALGYRVANQDAEAIARGNAFVATADNPSAVYYNPAGITQLEGHHASLGLYNVYLNSEYDSPVGVTEQTDFRIVPVPHAYYVVHPREWPVAFGVGLNNAYGLKLSWPEDTGFRTLVTKATVQYLSLNPVVAWEVTEGLSLAMGPTINYSQVQLKNGLFPGGTSAADELSFDGNGWDFGFTAGLLWQPHEQWSVGFNYRSATAVTHTGDLLIRPVSPLERSEAEVRFPSHFAFGVSYRPTPEWNLEFNLEYTEWEELRDVTITRDAAPDLRVPFNYESGFMYKAGVTRSFRNGLSLSAGYFFTENNVKDVSYNPAVPDTDLHAFSVGGAYAWDNWKVALAYQYITGPENQVSGSTPSLAGESADGDYQYTFHTLTVTLGFHF